MAEKILIEYQANVEGLKADLQEVSNVEKKTRDQLEKPVKLDVDTKEAEKQINNLGKSTGALGTISQKAKEGFAGLKDSLASALNPMTAVASAGVAIVGTFFKMIDVNRKFQQSLAELQSITGVTTKELEFYRQQAVEIAKDKTLSSSLSETVNAFKLVGSAKPELLGNKEALAEVTKQAILLSKASGDTLESSVSSLTGTLNQFSFGAEEAGRVIDVLAAGSKAGAVGIPDLSAGLEKFGAVAKANNVTVEQAVALQETLGDKQIVGAEAGTQLRNIILKLANAGKGYVNGQFDINAALEQTRKEFTSIQDPVKRSQELTKLFGLESVTAGQILLDNIDGFNKYTKAVGEQGVALSQAQTNTNTFDGALTRLSNSFEALLAGSGGILNVFAPIVDVLSNTLDYIGKFFNFVGTALGTFFTESQYIQKVIDLFGALWNAVKEIGSAIGDLFASLFSGFSSVEEGASGFAKVFDFLLTNVRIAIEGLILLINGLKDILVGAFEIMALQVRTFVNFWKAIFAGDFRGAFDVIIKYFEGLGNIVGKTFDKIKINVIKAVLGIAETVKPILDALGIDVNNLTKSLKATQKELSKKYEAKVKVTTTTENKNLATTATSKATSTATSIVSEGEDKASKGSKEKVKSAKELEKEKNDAILKERDKALKAISDLEVQAQKDLIARLEATGADKSTIDAEKIKLLEAEKRYNQELLNVREQFANQLASKYTETKEKELDAIQKGNEKILDEEKKIQNERIKFNIEQAVSGTDTNTQGLEKEKKRLESLTGLTLEEENKRKVEILKINQEILNSKLDFNNQEINALLTAGADYNGKLVQDRLKAQEDLSNQIIMANQATNAEIERQNAERLEREKEAVKAQINELYDFAKNGLLLEIGINPASADAFKKSVEGLLTLFNKSADDVNKSAGDKAREAAGKIAEFVAAAGAIASDAIFSGEQAQIEERRAMLAEEQEAELLAAGDNEQQKDAIKQKYRLKEKELQRKEAQNQKNKAIFDAAINGAVAITKTFAQLGWPAGIAGAAITAALTAAQIAVISSRPIPKFAKGGEVGGKPHSAGGTIIEAEKGEYIINKNQTAKNYDLIKAINGGRAADFIEQSFVTPRLAELAEQKEKRERDLLSLQSVLIQSNMKATLSEILATNQKTNTILKSKNNTNFSL